MQVRLTGDPYIAHCVETAAIVERLHASPKDAGALDDVDERCAAYLGKPARWGGRLTPSWRTRHLVHAGWLHVTAGSLPWLKCREPSACKIQVPSPFPYARRVEASAAAAAA